MISKTVLIFAGGYGTRLKHLTKDTPKPLVDFLGKPFLNTTLSFLKELGFLKVIVSTHFQKEKMHHYLKTQSILEATIIEELDPLKALLKAIPDFGSEPFLTLNADIIFEDYLEDFWTTFFKNFNRKTMDIYTLGVEKKNALFSDAVGDYFITPSGKISFFPFRKNYKKVIHTGAMIINPDFFQKTIIKNLPSQLTLLFILLFSRSFSYEFKGFWSDIGSLDSLHKTQEYLKDRFL